MCMGNSKSDYYIQKFSAKINTICLMIIGRMFAMMEIKLTLAKVIKKYDVFPAAPNPKEIAIREGTFSVRRPKHGIPVIFKKRDSDYN